MRQHIAVSVFLIAVALAPLQAQTADRAAAVGLRVVSETVDGGISRFRIETATGLTIDVRNDRVAALSVQQVAIVDVIGTISGNLETLDVERLTMTFSGNSADVALIPSRFVFEGVNLLPHVPAGLWFRFDQVLEYDFRVRVGEFFLRLRGQYIDEQQFANRVLRAVQDPIAFLESLRPEIIADRLNELDELTSTLTGLIEDLMADVDRLTHENRELEDRLADQQQRLEDVIAERDEALDVLRSGTLAVANQSFFGRLRAIDPSVVQAVVTTRQEHPEFTQAEIRSAASEAGFSASRSEVAAILAVYFGEVE